VTTEIWTLRGSAGTDRRRRVSHACSRLRRLLARPPLSPRAQIRWRSARAVADRRNFYKVEKWTKDGSKHALRDVQIARDYFSSGDYVCFLLGTSPGPASADGTPVRVRGTVVSLDGSKLVVHAKDGKDITVSLKDKYAALAVVKSSMDEIKQGTFIGTATEPLPDGSLRAVEVVVFPDSLRGFAEGHYSWDLGPKSMMTNATIAQKVQKVDGETIDVTYKGGGKKITIPANAPIVGLVPSEHSDIEPGANVFVPTEKQADGTLLSGAVLFGKGVVPPM
jgi:hypothetical protein